MRKQLKSQSGSTMILMSFFVLFSILIISLSLSAIVVNGLKMGTEQVHSTKAFFAAEAGAERIMWEIRKNNIEPGDGISEYCKAKPADFCFDISGDLSSCGLGCDTSETKTQTLSNGANYRISFDYESDPAYSTTTLTSYGNYQDINRTIKLQY